MALFGWGPAEHEAFVRMQFAAQRLHYRTYFPDAPEHMILGNGQPIGRIFIDRAEDEVRIVDWIIAPAYRNRGIGTALLRAIMEEGRRAHKPVRVRIDQGSPVLHLHERLGFTVLDESPAQLHLEWRAPD